MPNTIDYLACRLAGNSLRLRECYGRRGCEAVRGMMVSILLFLLASIVFRISVWWMQDIVHEANACHVSLVA